MGQGDPGGQYQGGVRADPLSGRYSIIVRSAKSMRRSREGPHPDLTCLCYHFDADLVLSLGRTADRACRRGDLVSQRGKEPKTHYRSSFEDNEGQNSR
jgi:hypothetical protein